MWKFIITIIVVFTNVLAQISLRKGMTRIDMNNINFLKVIEIISSFYIWTGLFFYAISFILYLYIVSKFEVSRIYAITTSGIFVLLLIFSFALLHEPITIKKIFGISLMTAGLIIISF